MAVDTDRRAKKIASRLEHALDLQPIDTTMTLDPSHAHAGVSARETDINSTQSPTEQASSNVIMHGQEPGTEHHQSSVKKRRASKSKAPGELRRTSSTPHMRNLALGNSGELSPTSNKARNKLGYHRTSVACGEPDLDCTCFGHWKLTGYRRALSAKKDSMSSCFRRSPRTLLKLHSVEERVQLLPSRTQSRCARLRYSRRQRHGTRTATNASNFLATASFIRISRQNGRLPCAFSWSCNGPQIWLSD
jgi:hypothetical protein